MATANKGIKTRFQLYTVPGQVMYNTTRRIVLRGVDGLVFVADSQWSKMPENVESLQNLEENLRLQGDSLEKIPYVLQFNKRDLRNVAPPHYLEYILNNRDTKRLTFQSVATLGPGVFETLNMISRLVLHRFIKSASPRQTDEATFVLA